MVRGRYSTPLDLIALFPALVFNAFGIVEMEPANAPPAQTDCQSALLDPWADQYKLPPIPRHPTSLNRANSLNYYTSVHFSS